MGRHITYDPVEVRRSILGAFWASGYAETSLADLERATGLNRRQLYNGPGDKKAMFLAALEDFEAVAGRRFLAPLERDGAGVDDIAALLRAFVALAGSPEGSDGCLVCSVSQETIASDADVRPRIDAYFDRIEGAYRNALEGASRRGEIDLPSARIRAASLHLFGIHVALCVLGRAGCPASRLSGMAEAAIDSLG